MHAYGNISQKLEKLKTMLLVISIDYGALTHIDILLLLKITYVINLWVLQLYKNTWGRQNGKDIQCRLTKLEPKVIHTSSGYFIYIGIGTVRVFGLKD